MNWNIVEGNWKEFKGRLHEKWGDLTQDDIEQLDGTREQLSGLLQKTFGWAQLEAEQKIDEWLLSLKESGKK